MTNESIPTAEFNRLSETSYKVAVTVPPSDFKKKLDQQYRTLAKNADIPGFRPGKAPANIINRIVGKEAVINQTIEDVVQDTLWPLVKKEELTVVGQPRINPGEYSDGSDFTYTAVMEVLPEVPLIDYDNLEAVLPEREITEKIIDDEVRNMGIRMGTPTVITDRPVQKGDFVNIEMKGETPDVLVPSMVGDVPWSYAEQDTFIEVGAGKAIAGLEDHLIGMELEEIKEFELTLPDDFGDPRVRGAALKATIRLIQIREIAVPEITEEFIAERMGQGVENLEALRERIKEEIQSNYAQLDLNAKIDQIEAQLSTGYTFVLPEGLIRREYVNVMDKSLMELKEKGIDIEELMEESSEAGIRVRKKARFQAERIVRLQLLMSEVARKESIGVPQEEILNYIAMVAYRSGIDEKTMKQWVQDPQFLMATKEELMKKKVSHFLSDKVKEKTVPMDEYIKVMESARTDGEKFERDFMESAEDPSVEMKNDYLEEAGEVADSDPAGEEGADEGDE